MELKGKHIAVICDYKLLEDRVGGMDYFFWAFNGVCKAQGVKIDWFFPNTSTHGDYHEFNMFSAENTSLEQAVITRLKTVKLQYTHIITHFVELCTSFFADIKRLQKKGRIIAVDHNPRPLNGYPFKKRIKKRLKGMLYGKHIDRFIGVSEYTSHAILKDFGGFLKHKVETIYNGVLIDDIIPKKEARRKVNPKFIVVSHLRYSKGIQDLIDAVHLLPEHLKTNLKIDVYGDGPYKSTLLDLVKSHKLELVFNFKGNSSSLKNVYQKYDYLIQPTHMECFSLSILESLAANVPVITTPVGGNTEVVFNDENGFIVKAQDVVELQKKTVALITGKKSITINTRTQIEKQFSINKMVDKHLALLSL
ncbi:glycosyltransferase family 4 protein [Thalassobellus citreus]|uniref:glycosyltransferase family 4 protein n=1 Tax=Thalassobellus citreus TaxID=3367752 RepID=UPI0037A97A28